VSKIFVGDTGTAIIVDCGSDISTATVHDIKVRKPNGDVVVWSASIYQNNFLKYITVDGDLNLAGDYFVESIITLPSWKGTGETDRFTVYKRPF